MREGKLWVFHLLAGAVIFFLLGMHMFIMHLDEILAAIGLGYSEPISAESVFHRSKHIFFMITYILLLGSALYHGLYGLKNILFEISMSKSAEKSISVFLTILGLALFAYGAFAAVFVFVN